MLSEAQALRLVERIRHFGRQAGLTSDRLIAEKAGIANGAMGAMRKPGAGPTLGRLLAICDATGVYSLDELLGFSSTSFFICLDEVEDLLSQGGQRLSEGFHGLLEG